MQAVLAPPGFGEVISLLGYILSHPHLFIGSTTVMTTGLVIGVGLTAALAAVGAPAFPTFAAMAGRALFWLAPKLALALVWFGVGSMILATEILLRFHEVFPEGTQMQFRSGLGHLVVAMIGVLLLRSRLAGRTRREWVEAHFWALTYMSVHVVLLTPPWFDFMFQGELVRTVANCGLALALAVNVCVWRSVRRTPQAGAAA